MFDNRFCFLFSKVGFKKEKKKFLSFQSQFGYLQKLARYILWPKVTIVFNGAFFV